jgi:hypothetical protein
LPEEKSAQDADSDSFLTWTIVAVLASILLAVLLWKLYRAEHEEILMKSTAIFKLPQSPPEKRQASTKDQEEVGMNFPAIAQASTANITILNHHPLLHAVHANDIPIPIQVLQPTIENYDSSISYHASSISGYASHVPNEDEFRRSRNAAERALNIDNAYLDSINELNSQTTAEDPHLLPLYG